MIWRIAMTSIIKRFSLCFFTFILASFLGCASSPHKESTGEFFDDATLTAKVKAAFVKDPEVKAIDINVETFKGVVQLSGFANSQAEISKAVKLARDVNGVKSVKNDIRLKSSSS
jgi:osmotically-inducible protein OsmY